MVSQKDKRRSQEGAQKRLALKDMEIMKAQKELVIQLKGLRDSRATKKLLKNAQHDGLDDIGMEARLLALDIFYKANRPSDMVELIKGYGSTPGTSTGDMDSRLCEFKLLAYSMLGEWNLVVPYAELLCNNNQGEDTSSDALRGPEGTREPPTKIRQAAILAFANTDQHISTAVQLWNQEINEDKTNTSNANANVNATALTNAILRSHVRTGTYLSP